MPAAFLTNLNIIVLEQYYIYGDFKTFNLFLKIIFESYQLNSTLNSISC